MHRSTSAIIVLPFSGKVVLITGATSGLGSATAQELSKQGARLVITGRKPDLLKNIQEKIEELSPEKIPVLAIRADLTVHEDVQRVIRETIKVCKRLDVLINCVSSIEHGSIETTNLEQYDRLMNINIRAVYHLVMWAVPELSKTKGNIVNVSSVCGTRAFPNFLAYNISKAAYDQFTRCVALEMGRKGVRCNSVNASVTATDPKGDRPLGMSEEMYVRFLNHCKTTHALGRAANFDEVVDIICFLASAKASHITGYNFPDDGGRQAMVDPIKTVSLPTN